MELTLADKMEMYRDGMNELARLEEEILEETSRTGERPEVDGVRIVASKGRARINWQEIAAELKASDEQIANFTTYPAPRVQWKGLAESIGVPTETKLRWTKPGTPSIRLELT